MSTIYTIGHSNHKLPKFLSLLEAHSIETLVDVRSKPFSRFSPHFNKKALDAALAEQGIRYVFAGDSLGGRPSDPTCYRDSVLPAKAADTPHAILYSEVMKRDWFREGIDKLLALSNEAATAMMCSEEDPSCCHRHNLIASYLAVAHPSMEVLHIRGDGNILTARALFDAESASDGQMSLFG